MKEHIYHSTNLQNKKHTIPNNYKKIKNPHTSVTEPLKNKVDTSTLLNNPHIKKKLIIDKQNYKTFDLKVQKKNQNSPKKQKKHHQKFLTQVELKQPKFSLKNFNFKKKKDFIKAINKTEDLKTLLNLKHTRRAGKSIDLKKYTMPQQNYHALSLSCKKKSASKQFKKTLMQIRQKAIKSKILFPKHQTSKISKTEHSAFINDGIQQIKTKKQTHNKRFYTQTGKKKKKSPISKRKSTFVSLQQSTSLIKKHKISINKQNKNISTIIGQKQMNMIDSNLIRSEMQTQRFQQVQKDQLQKVLLTQADEFNLQEFREFQQKAIKKISEKQDKNKKNEQEIEAAIVIQKYWRKYMKNKVLKNYSKVFQKPKTQLKQQKINKPLESVQQKSNYNHNVSVQSKQAIFKKFKIQHSKRYKNAIKQIKTAQLNKWNQMISLIQKTMKYNNKQKTQTLLKALAQKSQLNKQNLQLKTNHVLDKLQIYEQSKQKSNLQQENSLIDSNSNSSFQKLYDKLKNKSYKMQLQSQVVQKKPTFGTKQQLQLKLNYNTLNSKIQQMKKQRMHREQIIHQNKKMLALLQRDQQKQRQIKVRASNYNQSPNNGLYTVQQQSSSSSHKLLPFLSVNQYIQDQDPIQMLKAAQKLKKKIESMNHSKLFDSQFQIIQDDQDQDNYSAERSKYHNTYSQQSQVHLNSIQSQDLDYFQRNLNRLHLNKQSAVDQITNKIIKQIITYFIVEVSKSEKLNKSFSNFMFNTALKNVKRVVHTTKKIKGIKTNLSSIKQYINSLIAFIQSKKLEVIKNLEKPNGPTQLQMLSCMRPYQPNFLDDQQQQSGLMVLASSIFEQHWKQIQKNLKFQTFFHQPIKQRNRQQYLKGITQIYYRLLFDAFNQSLDYERIYGQFGKPFSWKSNPKFFHKIKQSEYDNILTRAIQRTKQVAISCCGIIFDNQKTTIQQYEIKKIREQKLSRVLALELLENQQKWTFYDDEQVQILLQVSKQITDMLLLQLINEIKYISQNRK